MTNGRWFISLVIAACCCIGASALALAAPNGLVRSSLDVKGDLWVGQRATLVVELFAPGFFASSATFDLPQVPGVFLMPPIGRPTLDSRTIDGTAYTVQRHELSVFAQRAGRIELPAFPVRFEFNAGGTTIPVPQRLMTTAVTLVAKLPPGAEGLSTLISTNDLTVDDVWTPTTSAAKVGDALTHRITFHASDVPGMVFPPWPADPIDGVSVYRKPPEVHDQVDRGELTGSRTETITYVFSHAGEITIPDVAIKWWDLDDKELKTSTIKGRSISIAPAPASAATTAANGATRSRKPVGWIVGIVLFSATATVIMYAQRRRLTGWWRERRQRRADGESARFHRFINACRAGDACHAYRLLLQWWQSASPDGAAVPLTSAANDSGHKDLSRCMRAVEDRLFGESTKSPDVRSLGMLAQSARNFRRDARHTNATGQRRRGRALAPLNP